MLASRWVWHNWVALAVLVGACFATSRVLSAPTEEGHLVRTPAEARPAPGRSDGAVPIEVRTEVAELNRLVLRSVARDPFRPDRARAPGRYRTPAQAAAALAATAPVSAADEYQAPPLPEATIVLRGIAIDGSGRAVVAVDINGQLRLMRVGEEFAGHRLLSAEPREAHFHGPTGPRTVRLGS